MKYFKPESFDLTTEQEFKLAAERLAFESLPTEAIKSLLLNTVIEVMRLDNYARYILKYGNSKIQPNRPAYPPKDSESPTEGRGERDSTGD
jgi:hypothetical protein